MSKVEVGNTVQVHYVGTFVDGTEFDSSRSRGEPISFKVGSQQMIKGFDEAIVGMTLGETKEFTLSPEDAYGAHNPEHIKSYPQNVFPSEVELVEGATVAGQNELGQQMVAKILQVSDEEVILDFNHPMAGKILKFDVEVMSVS